MKRLLLTCTDLMAIQFLVPHVKNLSEHGFYVELACSNVGGRMEELKSVLGGVAEVNTVRLSRSPFSAGNKEGYGDLKRIINGGKWDYIWTNEPVMGVMTRLAARKARKNGTKVVYMAHGFHFYQGAPKKNWLLYYPVEKYCSRLCDMIITINEEDYRRAKTFHAKRVEKIPGVGVNLDRFAPNKATRIEWRKKLGIGEDDIALLTVGELTPRKNQHVMIEAVSLLSNPKVKLFICGKGELESELKKQATELGIENQVVFLGYRKDIPNICCASDIFVFTSVQEGLPCALMEAMANGKPIVCSNIRGNVDLIDDGKGGMVVSNEPTKVAKAMSELINCPDKRAEMGRYNGNAVNAFREERAMEAVESLIIGL